MIDRVSGADRWRAAAEEAAAAGAGSDGPVPDSGPPGRPWRALLADLLVVLTAATMVAGLLAAGVLLPVALIISAFWSLFGWGLVDEYEGRFR